MRDLIINIINTTVNAGECADAILALEVPDKKIICPDKGRLMICHDCDNRHDSSKCEQNATIGDLIES
jgi:hypothetical protein